MRDGKSDADSAESQNLSMHGNSNRENRETSTPSKQSQQGRLDRSRNVADGNLDMYGVEESDGSVVPTKLANNEEPLTSESMEGRLPIKRNIDETNLDRAQNRVPGHKVSEVCEKLRKQIGRYDSTICFTISRSRCSTRALWSFQE